MSKEYTQAELDEIINEASKSVEFSIGKRAEITMVDGLGIKYVPYSETVTTNKITQLKFKTKLTEKQFKYVQLCFNSGYAWHACSIAILMNKLDISFNKAARQFLLSLKVA